MTARQVAIVAFAALVLLQPAWHAWLQPPAHLPLWLVLAIALAPLLLPAVGLLRRTPAAPFWAGLVALPYFAHGVAEAWSDPAARVPALLQVGVSLLLVLAVGAEGLRRRRARGRP